jgi:hypothetical protein
MGFHWRDIMSIDKESEDRFNAWLDSIEFVDEEGNVIDYELTDDISDDPEGDRE